MSFFWDCLFEIFDGWDLGGFDFKKIYPWQICNFLASKHMNTRFQYVFKHKAHPGIDKVSVHGIPFSISQNLSDIKHTQLPH